MTETTIARSRKKLPVDMFNGGKSKLEAPVSEDSVGLRSLQFLKAVRALRERPPEMIGRIVKHRGTAANKPVIAGTRIPVKSIKAFADAGYSIDQIREQYPVLTKEDIRAALNYGSRAA